MPYDASPPAEVTARDRLIQLRDFLASVPPKEFSYITWDCGTSACIGGWAGRLFGLSHDESFSTPVAELLGLSGEQARELFFDAPIEWPITEKHAVAVLDHLLATGTVDWSVAL